MSMGKLNPLQWFLHNLFGWETFKLPDAERLDVPKARRLPEDPIDYRMVHAEWPEPIRSALPRLVANGPRHKVRTFGDSAGVSSGLPMQLGTEERRVIAVGKPDYGEYERVVIPQPALGFYWTTGYPTPVHDKHASILDVDGRVHELIQLDTEPLIRLPFTTDANTWGLWEGDRCVEGEPTTASDLPRFMYCWTPWSHEHPHTIGLIVPDYVGGDGHLETGPRCGDLMVLDPMSDSYADMVALGGECRTVAFALATHGCVLIDRNGYRDAPHNRIGTDPNMPSFSFQAGRNWRHTNIDQLRIALSDLRLVEILTPPPYDPPEEPPHTCTPRCPDHCP